MNQHVLNKPIIFIGTGRSGTTIISEIISKHPSLAYISNYNNLFPNRPEVSLFRHLFDNSFYRVFGQKKQGINQVSILNKFIFTPNEAYQMWDYITGPQIDFSRSFLLDTELSQAEIHFIRLYFEKMVKYQGRKRLVFKITGPSRISFLSQIFPDALFVNLRREPIPTVSSFIHAKFWKTRGAHRLWWRGVYSNREINWADNHKDNAPLITAFQLKKIHEINTLEVSKCNPNYLEVFYEDFVLSPENEVKRILEFASLEADFILNELKKVVVVNRNKPVKDYFDAKTLSGIQNIFQTSSTSLK